MKASKAYIDFLNDMINIGRQDTKIQFTSSGYYYIPTSHSSWILNNITEDENDTEPNLLLSLVWPHMNNHMHNSKLPCKQEHLAMQPQISHKSQ